MADDDAAAASRREFLLGTAGIAVCSAGCAGLSREETDRSPTARAPGSATATADGDGAATETAPGRPEPLRVGVSGGLTEPIQDAATTWNANEAPERRFLRGSEVRVDVDGRVADHFAAAQGLERTESATRPPFHVATVGGEESALTSGLADGRLDLYAGPEPGVPDRVSDADDFVSAVVGYGGSGFSVSPAIADAGVRSATTTQLRDVYAGEVTNWSALGGPDREIHVASGIPGSPPRPLRRRFLGDVDDDGVDARIARANERRDHVAERTDAVCDLPVGAATSDLPLLAVSDDGVRRGPRSSAYAATYPLSCYTMGEPDAREAAFLTFLQSPIVQHGLIEDDELLHLDVVETVDA